MPIWITGARGFIGRNLARHLAVQRQVVLGLGHGAWPSAIASSWGVTHWVNGEVNSSNLKNLLRYSGTPEVIYHFAGGSTVGPSFQNPLEDFQRTVDTTAKLLEWIRTEAPSTKLLCASSAAVYGAGQEGYIPESARISPYSPYGFHKAMMEALCGSYVENFGLKIAIVRFFSIYGAGLEKQLLWDVCAQLAGKPFEIRLSGTGGEMRDWLHISDAVRLLDALRSLFGHNLLLVNGGTGQGTSVRQIVRKIMEAWGDEVGVRFDGKMRKGDPVSLVADVSRMKAFGFSPARDLADGIREAVDWYKTRLSCDLS
jgi:UDP-glucose 4-epimerase